MSQPVYRAQVYLRSKGWELVEGNGGVHSYWRRPISGYIYLRSVATKIQHDIDKRDLKIDPRRP